MAIPLTLLLADEKKQHFRTDEEVPAPVRDIHRALDDAQFKAYILKIAETSEMSRMENKEVTSLTQKTLSLSEQKNSVAMYVVSALVIAYAKWHKN